MQREKKSSQILAVSQREFTFPCLSKLLFKVSMVISKKIELDFVLSETRVMDRIICYCIILPLRKACGLINEGRENDILVFWPEIEQSYPGHMLDNNNVIIILQ